MNMIASKKTKIFFDHISKTAGTSLQRFLCDAFGTDQVSSGIKGLKLAEATSLYQQKKVLIGHFEILLNDAIPSGYMSTTLLRNPRERTLSMLFFQKNNVLDVELNPNSIVKSECLEDVFENEYFLREVSNTQSIHFARYFHPKPELLSPEVLFEYACRGLDQYDLVGSSERIDEFVDVLRKLFELSPQLTLMHMNVTASRKQFDDLSDQVRNRIDAITEVDRRLWEYAESLFDQQSRQPELLTKVPLLREQESRISAPKKEATAQRAKIKEGALDLVELLLAGRLRPSTAFVSGELVDLQVTVRANEDIDDLTIGYSIQHDSGVRLFGVNTLLMGNRIQLKNGEMAQIIFSFPASFGIGNYFINLSAHTGASHLECCYFLKEKALSFDVVSHGGIAFEGLVQLIPDLAISRPNGAGVDPLQVSTAPKTFRVISEMTPPIGQPKGRIEIMDMPNKVTPGMQLVIPVSISNDGELKWMSSGTRPVLLAYHWRNFDGSMYEFDGIRSPLPTGTLFPGQTARGVAFVEAPRVPGSFVLELTIVKEGEFWFEEHGFSSDQRTLCVEGFI